MRRPHERPALGAADRIAKEAATPTTFGTWLRLGLAVIWLLLGGVMLLAAFDDTMLEHERLLRWPDPIFNLMTRDVLFLASAIYVLVGVLLMLVGNAFLRLLGAALASLLLVVCYLDSERTHAGRMPRSYSYPLVSLAADKIGLNTHAFAWLHGILLLATTSVVLQQLLQERQRLKRNNEVDYLRQWDKMRQDKSRFR